MKSAIKWQDESHKSKDRTIFTREEIMIPGVKLFATHKIQNAILPLEEHYHEDAFEFTLVIKGNMSFFTAGDSYPMKGGDVFISYPNEIHSTHQEPISLNHQYWLQLDTTHSENLLFLKPEIATTLVDSLKSINRHVITTDNKEIRMVLESAYSLLNNNGPRLQIAGYLIVFFHLLISSSKIDTSKMPSDIELAINFIHEHICEPITLDFIADLCHLSTSHFKQKFRNIVGISPRDYINKMKIEYAKKLLLSDNSITTIAYDLGFNTSSYFSSVFKKYTTKSPREYISEQ
jgi:AraC-like DNA-binding protein